MQEFKITSDEAIQLQNFVQEHMDRCHEVIDFDGEELPEELNDVAMYCGCHICEVREHLLSTFTWLRVNGILDLYVAD
jgi:hypothetical protein